MNAQTIGQWLGLVVLSVTVGAIGFGFLQLALSVRDYFRRRAFCREAGRQLGESLKRSLETRQAVNIVAQPARRGGKTEALRLAAAGYSDWEPPPFGSQIPMLWTKHPGEIIIGERLAFESRLIDGDYPRAEPPRGIFGGAEPAPQTWPAVERLHEEVMKRRRE